MKIALLGDTHFGVRKGSDIFDEYFNRCFSEFVFPILEKHQIKEVIQLGDLFDDRKAVSTKSISESKDYFFDQLVTRNIHMITLLGNHDLYYKESLSVASQREFLSSYDNILIIDNPVDYPVGQDCIFGLMPWICDENRKESLDFIQNSRADIIIGHFEISNFNMYKGTKSRDGLSPDIFKRFNRVWSGHYHTRSSSNNISYLGTPYELTWQDCDDPRGIHIYDTVTDEIEFIENPIKLFRKIQYKENFINSDVSLYNKTFVKVYVLEKTNQVEFEQYVQKLYDVGAYSVEVIEDLSEFKETTDVEGEINIEDTMDILKRYIDTIDTDKDKSKIYDYMQTLYLESVNT